MIASNLQGLTVALVSAAAEVDRPQPEVEPAAAALLPDLWDFVLSTRLERKSPRSASSLAWLSEHAP